MDNSYGLELRILTNLMLGMAGCFLPTYLYFILVTKNKY